MTSAKPEGSDATTSGCRSRWMQCGVLGITCALVIGLYASIAHSGSLELTSLNAADTYYNLLVQGFRAGQLSLKKEAPPGLAQLADPYDPAANAVYRPATDSLIDMSYYKGRLYLYFGVTPALILFWPYAALTGQFLFHREAVVIFCSLGFLASVGLVRALWRRYFPEVSVGVVAACVVALGLATGVPVLLSRSEVYEVPISCGYMLAMLALGAIWCALHNPARRSWWLVLASVVYGLAVGARPSLLFGAVLLLVPVAQAWQERKPVGVLLMAAMGPILLIGLALMLYNALRFDDPFEFGVRYILGPLRLDTWQYFSLRYLWFDLRVYFLEPARWTTRFPFVREIVLPSLPPGHQGGQSPFGVLTNIPLVWLSLAVPLVWRGRSTEDRLVLRCLVAAVSLLMAMCALTIGLFFAVAMRYEVDFLPALVLLSVVGILGLERALADRPPWRRVVRWGWCLLLGFSAAFNLLSGVENWAVNECQMGNAFWRLGKLQEAVRHYEKALRIMPDNVVAHNDLGAALEDMGKLAEAVVHYEQALRIQPGQAEVHNNLGVVLGRMGKFEEAIGHYETALRIKPDYAEVHYNLGVTLEGTSRSQQAIGHYEQALRFRPDFTAAKNRLEHLRGVQ